MDDDKPDLDAAIQRAVARLTAPWMFPQPRYPKTVAAVVLEAVDYEALVRQVRELKAERDAVFEAWRKAELELQDRRAFDDDSETGRR